MGEQGMVTSVANDKATVVLERTEACAKCRACIVGFAKDEMMITVDNQCGAKVSDWVNIELEDEFAIKAVLIMYGVPLVSLLLGMACGYFGAQALGLLAQQELISFFTGMFFVAIAFFGIKYSEKYLNKRAYTPIATEILPGKRVETQ